MFDQAHDTDVLEPEPVRQGGLVQKDMVSLRWLVFSPVGLCR